MIENEVYLTHYIQQSCGWVKVHEYTCNGLAGAKAKEREIRARYPQGDKLMANYMVMTGDGDLLCDGVSAYEIERIAQEWADRLAETVYYCESGNTDDSDDEGIGIAVGPRTVRCECGQYTGERCEWIGPLEETVVVEYMPEYLRASHKAAGNAGRYPHNGAVRVRCERSCAESIVEHDADWARIVE